MSNIKLDVRVYPQDKPDNTTKAFASVTVEDLIAIKGIRVVQGSEKLFVTMPQSRDQEGKYHDLAFPVTGDLRKAMNEAIISEYKELTKTADKSVDKAAEKTATAPVSKKPSHDEPEM